MQMTSEQQRVHNLLPPPKKYQLYIVSAPIGNDTDVPRLSWYAEYDLEKELKEGIRILKALGFQVSYTTLEPAHTVTAEEVQAETDAETVEELVAEEAARLPTPDELLSDPVVRSRYNTTMEELQAAAFAGTMPEERVTEPVVVQEETPVVSDDESASAKKRTRRRPRNKTAKPAVEE